MHLYFEEPDAPERESAVWRDINEAFSRPVSQNEHRAEYVSTQIIAEMFRHNEIDGLIYKSSLCDGFNVALFDLNSAEVINCYLYQVKSVKFHSVEIR